MKKVVSSTAVVKKKAAKKQKPEEITPIVPTIKEVLNRGVLYEGRNNGMGFGYLKDMGNNEYHTVNPISPCKDYLCEVIVTEHTGKPSSGCGLVYNEKKGVLNEPTYLAILIMKTKDGRYSYSSAFENDVKLLKDNHKNIERMMNELEEMIGIPTRTVITEANDGYFLVSSPLAWHRSTISSSLYTLLLRCGLPYDGKKPALDYLSEYSYNGADKALMTNALPKLRLIIEKKEMPPNRIKVPKYGEKLAPHGMGIATWDLNFEEIPIC